MKKAFILAAATLLAVFLMPYSEGLSEGLRALHLIGLLGFAGVAIIGFIKKPDENAQFSWGEFIAVSAVVLATSAYWVWGAGLSMEYFEPSVLAVAVAPFLVASLANQAKNILAEDVYRFMKLATYATCIVYFTGLEGLGFGHWSPTGHAIMASLIGLLAFLNLTRTLAQPTGRAAALTYGNMMLISIVTGFALYAIL